VTSVGKGGAQVGVKTIDLKTSVPAANGQTQPIRTGNTGIVKPTSNPASPVQVNRPQLNTTPNRINNVTANTNFRESMNQAQPMNSGMNRRGGFMR
jgi:hypothetical protein